MLLLCHLRSIHEYDEPVVDGNNDISWTDPGLPGGSVLDHVVQDQVKTMVLTKK